MLGPFMTTSLANYAIGGDLRPIRAKLHLWIASVTLYTYYYSLIRHITRNYKASKYFPQKSQNM